MQRREGEREKNREIGPNDIFFDIHGYCSERILFQKLYEQHRKK